MVLAASWIGLQTAAGHIRVGVNPGVMAIVAFGISLDLCRHGRDSLRLRWPLLLSLPVLLADRAIAARGLQAWLTPGAVLTEMTVNSGGPAPAKTPRACWCAPMPRCTRRWACE